MVPNKPNMTTMMCRKFPRIGAHWKPRKSKICLSNADSYNQAESVHQRVTRNKRTVFIFISWLEKSAHSISITVTYIVVTRVVTPISYTVSCNLSKKYILQKLEYYDFKYK